MTGDGHRLPVPDRRSGGRTGRRRRAGRAARRGRGTGRSEHHLGVVHVVLDLEGLDIELTELAGDLGRGGSGVVGHHGFLSRIRSPTGVGLDELLDRRRSPSGTGRRTEDAQAVAQDDVEEQDEQLDVDEDDEQVDPNTVSV